MRNITSSLKEYKLSPCKIQKKGIFIENMGESLSQLVRRRRKELKLRNVDIATRSGLSRSYIGNIVNETAPTESGQYNLSPESVQSLAKALEISEIEITTALGYTPSQKTDSPFIELGLRFDKLPQTKKAKYEALIDYLDHLIELDEEEKKQGS